MRLLALLALLAAALAGCGGAGNGPSLLIVIVDEGATSATTPTPDEAVFERHYADRPLALALPAIAEPWVEDGRACFAIVAGDPPGLLQQLPLLMDPFVDGAVLDDRERIAQLAGLLERVEPPFFGYLRLDRFDVRLWEVLREADLERSTLVVLSRERVRYDDLAENAIRVPLRVRFPAGGRPDGVPSRVAHPTSHVELARSLRDNGSGMLAGEWPARVFVGDERGRALIEGRLKLVETPGAVALFDVVSDPGETRDLAAERPDELARLRELAARALDPDASDLDPAARERLEELRGLGYIR